MTNPHEVFTLRAYRSGFVMSSCGQMLSRWAFTTPFGFLQKALLCQRVADLCSLMGSRMAGSPRMDIGPVASLTCCYETLRALLLLSEPSQTLKDQYGLYSLRLLITLQLLAMALQLTSLCSFSFALQRLNKFILWRNLYGYWYNWSSCPSEVSIPIETCQGWR